jgi:hypothetical protein
MPSESMLLYPAKADVLTLIRRSGIRYGFVEISRYYTCGSMRFALYRTLMDNTIGIHNLPKWTRYTPMQL